MKLTNKSTVANFYTALTVSSKPYELLDELFTKLENSYNPQNLDTSADLNSITLDQLVSLIGIHTFEDLFFIPLKVLKNMDREEVMKLKLFHVVELASFIRKEVERIGKLWEKIKHTPSAEEVQAGIGGLSHGWFGIADWYALRMHMTNHDDAYNTKWIRIYQCQKNDHEKSLFEKRYRDILNKRK